MNDFKNICQKFNASILQRLYKKITSPTGELADKSVFPITLLQAIYDGITGTRLDDILSHYNFINVEYKGTQSDTRLSIPVIHRRYGLIVSYRDYDDKTTIEQYVGDSISDEDWSDYHNWKAPFTEGNFQLPISEEQLEEVISKSLLSDYVKNTIVSIVKEYTDEEVTPPIEGKLDNLRTILNTKANQSEVTELSDKIDVLNGTGVGSVAKAITDAFNDFATNVTDDNIVNSYKELIDWAATHGGEAAEFAASIQHLNDLLDGIGGEGDPINVKAAIAKAISDLNIENYLTESEINDLLNDYTTKEEILDLVSEITSRLNSKLSIDSFNEWSETVATKEDVAEAIAGVDVTELLTNYATKAEVKEVSDKVDAIKVPTKVSELTNDSKYQTEAQVNAAIQNVVGAAPEALDTLEEIAEKLGDNDDVVAGIVNTLSTKVDATALTEYYNKTEVDSKIADAVTSGVEAIDLTVYETKEGAADKYQPKGNYLTEHQDISGKADKSEIPSLEGYATESWVEDKNYLTEHLDISGKVDKVSGKGLSTNDYTTQEKEKLNDLPTKSELDILLEGLTADEAITEAELNEILI